MVEEWSDSNPSDLEESSAVIVCLIPYECRRSCSQSPVMVCSDCARPKRETLACCLHFSKILDTNVHVTDEVKKSRVVRVGRGRGSKIDRQDSRFKIPPTRPFQFMILSSHAGKEQFAAAVVGPRPVYAQLSVISLDSNVGWRWLSRN